MNTSNEIDKNLVFKFRTDNFEKIEIDPIGESNFYNFGFALVDFPTDLINSWESQVRSVLPAPDHEIIRAGYSMDVASLLTTSMKEQVLKLAQTLLSQNLTLKYLNRPRVVGIHLLWSFYDEQAIQKTTHAHLWHRDEDDWGPQIKLFVPLTDCDESNGRFSASSKEICKLNQELNDIELNEKLSGNGNAYQLSDASRVSDETFRKNFESSIFDLNSTKGQALLIDTDSCYHKGGLVTSENKDRLMLQISLGSVTHSWNQGGLFTRLYRRVLRGIGARKYYGKVAILRAPQREKIYI